jgi:hypothetical protein
MRDGVFGQELASDADCGGTRSEEITDAVEIDSAGWDQRDVWKRSAQSAQIRRTANVLRRKDFHHVRSAPKRFENLRWRQSARKHRDIFSARRIDDLSHKTWRHDELRTRIDGAPGSMCVGDSARAEKYRAAELLLDRCDSLDSVWDSHRDFHDREAGLHKSFNDPHGNVRALRSDHWNDSDIAQGR